MYLVEQHHQEAGRDYVGVFHNKDDAEDFIRRRKATYSKRSQALLDYDIIDVPLNPSPEL